MSEIEIARKLRAILRRADDPHTLLLTNEAGAAMMAFVSGAPAPDPGFAFDRLEDHRLVVTEVVPGGAAAAAGIEPGDILSSVDGEPLRRGIEVTSAILGARADATIVFEVLRRGEARKLLLRPTSTVLPIVSSRFVEPGLGYVRIRAITTSQDPERDAAMLLRRALDELSRGGARALVLDLRGNQGGYGNARVASVLTDGDPIVIIRHSSGDEEAVPRIGARSLVRLPLVVLVDGETNSAAEMVAFALQQHGDARVVGRPTAGGMNVPVRTPIGDRHVLMLPGSEVLGPRTRRANAGMRVVPDVPTPPRSAEDTARGLDHDLDAARRALASILV